MDGRGHLARLLTRLAPWRARPSAKPPPAARARGRARVRLPWWLLRPMWRVLRPILQAQPPRGAGVAAAALIMLASVAYGVVRGDHVATIVEALKDLRDSAANAAGFRIVALALTGERHMSREEVLATAGVTGRTSLLFLDVDAARERLKANPWVADATVLKLYPGELQIGITERAPFALWQKAGRLSLVWAARPVDAVICLRPSRPTANCEVIHRRGGGAIRIDGDVSQDGCYFVRRAPLAHHQERYFLRYYGASSNGSVEVLLSGCGNDVLDAREQARGLCVNRVGVRIVMKATRTIGGNRGHEVEVRDNVELLAGAVVSGDVVEVKDVISDDCGFQAVGGVGDLCGRVTADAESQGGEEDERQPGPRHEKLRVRCGHQVCVDEACTPKKAAGGQGPIKCRLPDFATDF